MDRVNGQVNLRMEGSVGEQWMTQWISGMSKEREGQWGDLWGARGSRGCY